MGCTVSQKRSINDTVLKRQNDKDEEIYRRLRPIMDLDNHNNVNQKYKFLIKIEKDKFEGTGIFKTKAYHSKMTPELFEKKIEEFWGILNRN